MASAEEAMIPRRGFRSRLGMLRLDWEMVRYYYAAEQ